MTLAASKTAVQSSLASQSWDVQIELSPQGSRVELYPLAHAQFASLTLVQKRVRQIKIRHRESFAPMTTEVAAAAALPVGEITNRVHSRDKSFYMPSGIVLNVLSVARQFTSVGTSYAKLHKTVTPSQINIANAKFSKGLT